MSASSFVRADEWDRMNEAQGKRFTPLKDSTSQMWKDNSVKRLKDGFNEATETLTRQFIAYLNRKDDRDSNEDLIVQGSIRVYPFRIDDIFVYYVAGYGETFLMPVGELR